MITNNLGFLRKAWLCLCLFLVFTFLSCSVSRQENQAATRLKTYQISACAFLPGHNEGALYSVLGSTTILRIDHLPEQLRLSVKVNDEAALKQLLTRLQASGFRILNTTLAVAAN